MVHVADLVLLDLALADHETDQVKDLRDFLCDCGRILALFDQHEGNHQQMYAQVLRRRVARQELRKSAKVNNERL